MNFVRILPICLLLTFFVGCKVKTASVDVTQQNEELYLTTKATFTSRIGVVLPYIDLPIIDFSTNTVIGNIISQNGDRIQLDLNLSKVFDDITFADTNLPNGMPLPFIFEDGVKIYSFEVSNSHIRVYIAVDDKLVVAGIAIPISLPHDNISDPYRVFAGFNVKGVNGAVGTFHGPNDGENGFAVFFNVSAELEPYLPQQNYVETNSKNNDKIFTIDSEKRSMNRTQKRLYRKIKKYLKKNKHLELY